MSSAEPLPAGRTGYQLHFEDIVPANPQFGSAALVPWDSRIFQFPVASYRPGPANLSAEELSAFRNHLRFWLNSRQASLCSCSVSPGDFFWRAALQEAGFHFVDISLQPTTFGLPAARLPQCRYPVRLAEPGDQAAILAIAAESFAHGRYHADPLFPRALANLRYRAWIENALLNPNPEDLIFVLEQEGELSGFFHVTVEGPVSDLRLAAVSPRVKSTLTGVDLYVGALSELRRLGVRRVTTVVSGTNTPVVNIFASLGFHFDHPELIYHWHGETLPNLEIRDAT